MCLYVCVCVCVCVCLCVCVYVCVCVCVCVGRMLAKDPISLPKKKFAAISSRMQADVISVSDQNLARIKYVLIQCHS